LIATGKLDLGGETLKRPLADARGSAESARYGAATVRERLLVYAPMLCWTPMTRRDCIALAIAAPLAGQSGRIIDPHVHVWKNDPRYPWAKETMIGQTLGHYRIEVKLGEGGMGVVLQGPRYPPGAAGRDQGARSRGGGQPGT
jgi:hypothetical protein